jgi:RND superfamily putative drug exporter
MFDRISKFTTQNWPRVIVFWVVLAVLLRWASPRWDDVSKDGDLAHLPTWATSRQAETLLKEGFPEHSAGSEIGLTFERRNEALTEGDLEQVELFAESLRTAVDLPIVRVLSPSSEGVGSQLISQETDRGQAAVVIARISNEFMATDNIRVMERVIEMMESFRGRQTENGLRLEVSGSAAVGGDTLISAKESIAATEWGTILLILAILFMVYRAPLLAVIPILAISVSVLVAFDVVALAADWSARAVPGGLGFKVFKTTKIFIVVVLFGSGTDYCLFLIARYREELCRGLNRNEALTVALSKVGSALAGSAMTTILGLAVMGFADFGKFKSSGPAIAVCLAVTLAACVTLAPALLRMLGRWLFWPGKEPVLEQPPPRRHPEVEPPPASPWHRLWSKLADAVLARPGVVLASTLLVLAPLAWEGIDVRCSFDLLADLDRERPSVRGTDVVRRYFSPGETGPLVIAAVDEDGRFDTAEGHEQINRLLGALYEIPGVQRVRSVTEPLGDRPKEFSRLSLQGLRSGTLREMEAIESYFVASGGPWKGQLARLEVVTPYDPFSRQSITVLNQVEARLRLLSNNAASEWHAARFEFGGITSSIRDLERVIGSDQSRIQTLVVMAVFLVLLVLLRRVVVSLFLIVSVVFSYLVTIGATEIAFGWLYGDDFRGLDWKAPLFLYVILTAIGEDYNIYLVTRVMEEQKRHGATKGLREAIIRTGGIISSCGVIMAGSFISMTLGSLRGIQELGFSLSLGVLLDTFLVRPILVPAFLRLSDRRTERVATIGQGARSQRKSRQVDEPAVAAEPE